MLSKTQFKPGSPSSGHNWLGIVLIVACAGLLLMTLFYPFGYDQAAFGVGGDMVLQHHAIPYLDFLDTKPPLLFYIYALASAIFGHHMYSIRAFDVLFQSCCLIYFYRILRSQGLGKKLASASVLITLLQYVGSGFWNTAQAESFQFLPALVLVDMTLRVSSRVSGKVATGRDRWLYGILAGIALASAFLLKFTLILILPAIALFLLLDRNEESLPPLKAKLGFLLSMCLTFALLLGGYAFFLGLNHGWTRFVESLAWVSEYAALAPLFSVETISKQYFVLFPQRLLLMMQPTLLAAGLIGLARTIPLSELDREAMPTLPRRLLLLLAIVAAFGLLGVLYERKMFQYHYARALWALSPFVAIGLESGWRLLMDSWKNARGNWSLQLSIIAIVVAALFFSPLTQVVSHPIRWTLSALRGDDPFRAVQERIPEYYALDMKQVANVLEPLMKSEDQLFFWGNEVYLYYELHRLPTTIALTNTPLRTSFTPDSWKQSVMTSLRQHPPRFAVVEFGDAKEFITGSPDDSYEAMMKWGVLRDFIGSNYHVMKTMTHFIIYEHQR